MNNRQIPDNPNLDRKPLSEINVTPIIDVALTLLIMFIITAPLLQSRIDVSLPTASRSIREPVKSLVISVTKDQTVYIENRAYFISNVRHVITSRLRDSRDLRVFIEGDSEVPYGFIIEVMDEVKLAGIEEVGLVIQERER